MRAPHFLLSLLLTSLVFTKTAQAEPKSSWNPAHSEKLQSVVDAAVQTTLNAFADKKLGTNELAVTLIDLRDPQKPIQASYRGGEQTYPASVVKLFYLVAAHRWMEDGKLADTEELRRAMKDMIVDSLNEATGLVVDSLTGTTSGPELSPAELEKWYDKRNAVNRYYTSLGFTNINVNRKPWCEGPYGREMQSVKVHKPNHRNWLTTDSTARLLTEIVTHQAVSAKRCDEMMELLRRDPFSKSTDADNQARGFTGMAIPPGTKLWSKAGWTSQTRHDAAYLELPTGEKFVLVTFTENHANEREIIPTVARAVIAGLSTDK
jgi:beta-lactamase family protein